VLTELIGEDSEESYKILLIFTDSFEK